MKDLGGNMKKKIIFIFITFFLFSGKVYASNKINAKLYKCVDGDTAYFTVNDKEIKTRFLAINTPESTTKKEPFGKEASEYTCNKLSSAKKIELEYDENSTKTDKYDRHLVWVYVDGKLLQEDLIKEGLAEVKYIYGDYKYIERLQNLESIAKNNKLNMWSNEEDNFFDEHPVLFLLVIIFLGLLITFNKKYRKKFMKDLKKELKI